MAGLQLGSRYSSMQPVFRLKPSRDSQKSAHLDSLPGGGSISPIVRMIMEKPEKFLLKMKSRLSFTVAKGKNTNTRRTLLKSFP